MNFNNPPQKSLNNASNMTNVAENNDIAEARETLDSELNPKKFHNYLFEN